LAFLGLAVATGLNQKMNWREFMGQQIEKSPQASTLSAEQREQRIEAGAKFAPVSTYIFGVPAPVILVLVVALIAIGFAATNPKKLKGGTSFGVAFGMFAVYLVLRVGLAFAFS
jgi:hypothetical protein